MECYLEGHGGGGKENIYDVYEYYSLELLKNFVTISNGDLWFYKLHDQTNLTKWWEGPISADRALRKLKWSHTFDFDYMRTCSSVM